MNRILIGITFCLCSSLLAANPYVIYEPQYENFASDFCREISETCTVSETKNICLVNTLYQLLMDEEYCSKNREIDECYERIGKRRDEYAAFLQENAFTYADRVRQAAWACEKENPIIAPASAATLELSQHMEQYMKGSSSYPDWTRFFPCFLLQYEQG